MSTGANKSGRAYLEQCPVALREISNSNNTSLETSDVIILFLQEVCVLSDLFTAAECSLCAQYRHRRCGASSMYLGAGQLEDVPS